MSRVRLYKQHPAAKLPTYATEGSACVDLYSRSPVWIEPGTIAVVDTGICVILEPDWCMQILSKSGLASKGIYVLNAPGIIDSDYRASIKVIVHNVSDRPYQILQGDKIAQGMITPVYEFDYEELTSEQFYADVTARGEGGLGSTGR